MGTLLLSGCISNTGNGSDATEPTPEPSEVPETEFSFSPTGADSVKIAHFGDDYIVDEATKKLAVTVNGERVPVTHDGTEGTYIVADDDQLKENETAVYGYPFSVGNVVTVTASPSDIVEVVWYPQHGEKQVIAEYTVPEPTPTPTTETAEATETTEATETADTTDE